MNCREKSRPPKQAPCARRIQRTFAMMLYDDGLSTYQSALIAGYKSHQTVYFMIRKRSGSAQRRKENFSTKKIADVSFCGLDMSKRSVRRLKALEMYANGAPVKNIEEDTGIWARLLPRLATTYGIPIRRG